MKSSAIPTLCTPTDSTVLDRPSPRPNLIRVASLERRLVTGQHDYDKKDAEDNWDRGGDEDYFLVFHFLLFLVRWFCFYYDEDEDDDARVVEMRECG